MPAVAVNVEPGYEPLAEELTAALIIYLKEVHELEIDNVHG